VLLGKASSHCGDLCAARDLVSDVQDDQRPGTGHQVDHNRAHNEAGAYLAHGPVSATDCACACGLDGELQREVDNVFDHRTCMVRSRHQSSNLNARPRKR